MAQQTDNPQTFGRWVRQQRKQRDLTQQEFARQLGCASITLSKLEVNTYRPSKDLVLRLARCLEIPDHEHPALLRFARGESHEPPSAGPAFLDPSAITSALRPALGLPILLTGLLGRSQELSELRSYVLDQGIRLVTLTGPGGVGKTRLVLQLATELRQTFQQQVTFIPLAPLQDSNLLLATIAQHLGLTATSEQAVIQALVGSPNLLILDNFEHLLPAAPRLVTLLTAAPSLSIVVTSRARLQLYGETEMPVLPLELPSPGQLPPLSELAQVPTVALFVERARSAQGDFALTPENAASVAEICQRLDGLPLAIELAAARIKLLAPVTLLGYLSSRLKLLTDGPRDLAERQQTLRQTIDWSYALLSPDAQALFAQLGVFVGGATLEALTTICADPQSASYMLVQTLTTLLDNSMLQRTQDHDGEERFVMLETLREYALEVLEQRGATAHFRHQHAAYYLTLAETTAPLLKGAEQDRWLTRLEVDHHNLRAALIWSSLHNPEQAVRLSGALARFWYMHGHFSEGHHWLQTTLDQGHELPDHVQANGLYGLGLLAYAQGDYQAAKLAYDTSLILYQGLENIDGIVATLNNLGLIAWTCGDLKQAASLFEECLPLWHQVDDTWGLACSLGNLGGLALDQADFERATTYYDESYRLHQQLKDTWGMSITLNNLGWVAYYQATYDQAEDLFNQALTLVQKIADKRVQAEIFEGQARVSIARADLSTARHLLHDSIQLRQQQGEKYGLVQALESLTKLLVAENLIIEATTLLGAIAVLRNTIGIAYGPLERRQSAALNAAVLSQISQAEYDRAWQAGATLPLKSLLAQIFEQ